MTTNTIETINEKLAAFKAELDPIAGRYDRNRSKLMAETIIEYMYDVMAFCIANPQVFHQITLWESTGGNNSQARQALENMGITYPFELAYLWLIGIEDDVKAMVKAEMELRDQQKIVESNPTV